MGRAGRRRRRRRCSPAPPSRIAVWLGLPPTLAALVALAAAILVTGSLHEDGVADIADGFGGGNTRERKLEIMKDSRNGTFGVVALVMTLLARWAAIAAVGASGEPLLRAGRRACRLARAAPGLHAAW